ncbi:hypothetical protein AWQ21_04910 [Picosynechococcus sp. PCC 7003]|uniref:hypothetical protein n=1 Tax=Picosynechococcus sp. PCC 7003 TaxID=374981 RepID=UPI000810BD2B|nr:hypothetical protein [Picosynechococcus sp. PCC 7003]ANV83777.1 hypothetical protein AWQ21_04910 [Picosynechococcus sp. PCC 7003]
MSFLMQLFGALALFSLGGSLWMKSFQRKVSLALLVISVIGLVMSTRSHLAFMGTIDTRSPQEIAAEKQAAAERIIEEEERNRPRNTEPIVAPPGQSLSLPRSGEYTLPESLQGKELNLCFTYLGIPGQGVQGQKITLDGYEFIADESECFPLSLSDNTFTVTLSRSLESPSRYPDRTSYEIYSDPTIAPGGIGVPPQIVAR